MSPGGHLFLRGASHLALLPHRGRREERGGEKGLDEWRQEAGYKERKESTGQGNNNNNNNMLVNCRPGFLILAATLAAEVEESPRG